MSQETASPPQKQKKRWFGGVGCAIAFVVGAIGIPLLLALSVWAWFQWQTAGYRQQLAAQEQRVRDSGEPLDGIELNAWYRVLEGDDDLTPLYLAILESLTKNPRPDPAGVPFVGPDPIVIPLPGESWSSLGVSEAYLAHYEPTFSLLSQTLQREGSVRYPVDFREGVATKLEQAQSLREVSRLCSLRAAVLVHQKEYAAATDTLLAAIRAAETLRNEPTMVSQLVRVSMHGMASQSIAFAMTDEEFPVEQIERLKAELLKIDRDSAAHTAMMGERAGMAYQSMLGTLDQLGDVPDTSFGAAGNRPLRELRPGDCAQLLEVSTDAVEASTGKYPELWRTQQALVVRTEAIIAQEKQKQPWNMNVLTALLLPAHDAAYTAFARGSAQHRCTIVLLAAEQRRREQGNYPQRLDDLVPQYLAVLPADPYTGRPLLLRNDPVRFIVYSPGKDEIDDGGDVNQSSPGNSEDTGIAVPPFRAHPEEP